MRTVRLAAFAVLLVGCPADPAPGDTEDGSETGSITTANMDTTLPTTGGEQDTTSGGSGQQVDSTDTGEPGSTEDSGTASGDGSGTDTSDTVGTDTGGVGTVDCGMNNYACGDGKDNDGDGLVDLMDPECTGPCDDDESSFQTGINGDNVDCKQDCFFDGNSGQGDDGCNWDLTCDPANPGLGTSMPNCEYTGGMNCDNMPPNQDADCIEFCLPFVPPGCDCFGCCEVTDAEGNKVSIFINSPDPECSIDNLDACNECTQSEDCINTCEEEECELCFGEDELPEGCDENTCEFGDVCESTADCPTDWYCLNNCCYPPPPG